MAHVDPVQKQHFLRSFRAATEAMTSAPAHLLRTQALHQRFTAMSLP